MGRSAPEHLLRALNEYGPPAPEAWHKAQSTVQSWWDAVRPQGAPPPAAPPSAPLPPVAPLRTPRLPSLDVRSWFVKGPRRQRLVWTVGGMAVVGLALALVPYLRRARAPPPRLGGALRQDGTRMQAVVVLGGDTPWGEALVLELASRDLIVLATVSSDGARAALEAKVPASSRGYVRALFFDAMSASDAQETEFLHALHSTLCLRFPLTTTGDPYAGPGESIEVLGALNALCMALPTSAASSTSLAKLDASELDTALHRFVAAPISTMSKMASLMARPSNRAPLHRALVMCTLLAAGDTRVAWPDHGANGVVSQAALASVDALRREWAQAWLDRRTAPPGSRRGPTPRRMHATAMYASATASHASVEAAVSCFLNMVLGKDRLREKYTVHASSPWRQLRGACAAWLASWLPTSWLDIWVATQTRAQRRAAPRSRVA